MTDTPNWSFETRQIHVGQEQADPATGARALPIYQTTSYVFNDTEHAKNLFALSELGNIYTRIMNPTQDAIEKRLASLEGGVGALLLGSGMSATIFAIINIAQAGDHVVASPALYGGTYNLFANTLPKLGIEVTFVEDPATTRSPGAPRPARTPSSSSARRSPTPSRRSSTSRRWPPSPTSIGVPLVVDNTIATPYLLRPIEHGADIVVHAATKYLGGHGTTIAGAIVDCGELRLRRGPGALPELQHARPELPRAGLRPRSRQGRRLRRQPRLHPQGARAAAA